MPYSMNAMWEIRKDKVFLVRVVNIVAIVYKQQRYRERIIWRRNRE